MDEIVALADLCRNNNKIDADLYEKYDVKRGLRDANGNGVVVGLTRISDIRAKKNVDGTLVPIDGELYYRGYNVIDLIKNKKGNFGFEEAAYLLLFDKLPKEKELADFCQLLSLCRSLPSNFVRDVILKAPNKDIINNMAKSILTLYSYDKNADKLDLENVLGQCIQLIANMPLLAVYAYQAHKHKNKHGSLIIHIPNPKLSTAENILRMLRADSKYTELEANVLDVALILHAEHGGGNNSTFTTHVVTSAGTDTYSALTAALCSLKGHKHGGANIKVVEMFDNLKSTVQDTKDEKQLEDYVDKLLNKEAFDRSGLVYGLGHAVYSLSDPRAETFKYYVRKLAEQKGMEDEYRLYAKVEEIAVRKISEKRKI
ncbi:MAG: citrate synthase, partial [Christensenellales bacterium]